MTTFEFENGQILEYPTLGHALEYAYKTNQRIVRYWK